MVNLGELKVMVFGMIALRVKVQKACGFTFIWYLRKITQNAMISIPSSNTFTS
jgi:hypothetical protein